MSERNWFFGAAKDKFVWFFFPKKYKWCQLIRGSVKHVSEIVFRRENLIGLLRPAV